MILSTMDFVPLNYIQYNQYLQFIFSRQFQFLYQVIYSIYCLFLRNLYFNSSISSEITLHIIQQCLPIIIITIFQFFFSQSHRTNFQITLFKIWIIRITNTRLSCNFQLKIPLFYKGFIIDCKKRLNEILDNELISLLENRCINTNYSQMICNKARKLFFFSNKIKFKMFFKYILSYCQQTKLPNDFIYSSLVFLIFFISIHEKFFLEFIKYSSLQFLYYLMLRFNYVLFKKRTGRIGTNQKSFIIFPQIRSTKNTLFWSSDYFCTLKSSRFHKSFKVFKLILQKRLEIFGVLQPRNASLINVAQLEQRKLSVNQFKLVEIFYINVFYTINQ